MTAASAPVEAEPRRGLMATLWYGYARVIVALRCHRRRVGGGGYRGHGAPSPDAGFCQ